MGHQGKIKLSRRDFLRLVGLGAGAAAVNVAAAPTRGLWTDSSTIQKATRLQDRPTDPAGRPRRAWWVKVVDQPTTEIQWDKVEPISEKDRTVRNIETFTKYAGADVVETMIAQGNINQANHLINDAPGWGLKDQALYNAQTWDAERPGSFLGPQTAPTPESLGVPKWTGSPEEASKMIRAAMRHFGAARVTFLELDENTKKFIYSNDPDGKPIVFEDIDQAYESDQKRVIPNKAKWVIIYSIRMSMETLRRAPTHIACQTTLGAYGRSRQIQGLTQEFLRGLGYQGLGESSANALGIAPAFAVLSGMGELGRHNRVITPEFGPMVRIFKLVTDLPVAVDKPINANIINFCKKCKKCAEACPADALSFENEPSWQVRGPWNNPGHKAWFEDSVKCMEYWETIGNNCTICFAVCPFSKEDKAWIHDWVKAGISTMPIMDGFIRSMDDAFGYGVQADPEGWWDLDLPEYGIDTEATVVEE